MALIRTISADALDDEADATGLFDASSTPGSSVMVADTFAIEYGSLGSHTKRIRVDIDGSANVAYGVANVAAEEWIGLLFPLPADEIPTTGNTILAQWRNTTTLVNAEVRVESDGSINIRRRTTEVDSTAAGVIVAGTTYWIAAVCRGSAASGEMTLELYDDAGTLIDTLAASGDFRGVHNSITIGARAPSANLNIGFGAVRIYDDTTVPAMPTFASNVDATPFEVAVDSQAPTVAPGALAITATPFAIEVGPQAATVTPAPLTVAATPFDVEASAQAATVAPDALAVAASPFAVEASMQAADPTLAPVAITASPFVVEFTPQAPTVTGGVAGALWLSMPASIPAPVPLAPVVSGGAVAVNIDATPFVVEFSGQTASVTFGAATVSATPFAAEFTAQAATVAPGALTVAATPFVVEVDTQAATVTLGASTVTASPFEVEFTAPPPTVAPGAFAVTAIPFEIEADAQAATVTYATQTVTGAPFQVEVSMQAATATGGVPTPTTVGLTTDGSTLTLGRGKATLALTGNGASITTGTGRAKLTLTHGGGTVELEP